MPGWDGYDVAEHLARSYDVPVVVENDANATALGEWVSRHPDTGTLCLIKVSTGIGCGIVVAGQVLSGVDGGAGDIGHIRLDGHEEAVCTCGSHGCLAAVAGGGAVAARLAAAGAPVGSVGDVRTLLDAGDVRAEQETRQAGRLIGRTASMLNSVLNPGVMVITGDLASAPLLAGIQEALYEYSLPRATRNLQVTLGGLGDSAAQVGLSRMVADRMFDAQTIDRNVGYA
jgi:predicted NBD/HSP70 family sugar kinase